VLPVPKDFACVTSIDSKIYKIPRRIMLISFIGKLHAHLWIINIVIVKSLIVQRKPLVWGWTWKGKMVRREVLVGGK
jgi:hypothetical protein